MFQNLPTDPEKRLQKLLKIKQLEQPEEGFSERFLKDFQQRQRSEVMRRSSFELFWDRLETLLGGSTRSRYALAGAATALFVVVGISLNSFGPNNNAGYTENSRSKVIVPGAPSKEPAIHPVDFEVQKNTSNQMRNIDLRSPENSENLIEF